MEAPVSIFQESPLAGEPLERLFHIHSVNRYQLRTKYFFTRLCYCDKYTVATLNNNILSFSVGIFFVDENLTTFN